MRCRVSLLLCALLVCSAALGAVPAAGQQQADGTHLEVQLQTDGDAAWNVTVRMPIADEREREEFEAFASDFEAGESGFDLGAGAFEQATSEASAASGREMSITSVQRDSEVVNASETGERYGVLRLSFTWEAFARVGDDGTVYVDDAFNTTDGTWLPGLGPDQSLTIRAPSGYGGPSTSPIGAEEGSLHWEGPETFEPGYFSIVYPPTSTGPAEPPESGLSTALVAGAVVLSGAALLLGVYLLFARGRDDGDTSTDEGAPPTAGATEATEGNTADSAEPPESETDTAGGSGAATTTADEEPDFELLSDEERVNHLLEQNGGRMKQATIVKETGWSNAKVSQLLSAMDEEDRVDKLRIGRENLISLPGEGVGDIETDRDGS